jgi:hypothetical protein
MKTFEIIGSLMILSGLFIAYHMYVAPEMDEQGRITKPGKKLKDLWRKRR